MKKLFVCLTLMAMLAGCERKPEFYIDGKPYYTNIRCIVSHNEYKWEYHYGYSFRGKFEYYYGPHNVYVCDEYKTDTIELNHPQR